MRPRWSDVFKETTEHSHARLSLVIKRYVSYLLKEILVMEKLTNIVNGNEIRFKFSMLAF